MGVQSALLTDIKVESKFVGYTELTHDSELFVIIQGDALVNEASAGTAELILLKHHFMLKWWTIADRGYVKIPQGSRCQRGGCEKAPNGQFLHKVEVLAPLAEGQIYQVDERMRTRILKIIRQPIYCIVL